MVETVTLIVVLFSGSGTCHAVFTGRCVVKHLSQLATAAVRRLIIKPNRQVLGAERRNG